MGTLRNKMIDAMKLRRFSLRTEEAYLGAVSALAKYYNLAPDQINSDKIQAYLLQLTVECGRSWGTCNVAVCGLPILLYRGPRLGPGQSFYPGSQETNQASRGPQPP